MENHLLIDVRNALMFSLLLASGALFPEAPRSVSRTLLNRWKRLKESIRSIRSGKKGASSSFWEIDMTKFEP